MSGRRVPIRPRGFWAESTRRKLAWVVNRTIAKFEAREQAKPIAVHEKRLAEMFRKAFERVDWDAWARRNMIASPDSGLMPKAGELEPPPIDLRGLEEELTALGRSAAELGWRRGQASLNKRRRAARKAEWSAKAPEPKKPPNYGVIDMPDEGDDVFVPLPEEAFQAAMAETFANVSGITATTQSQMQGLLNRTMDDSKTFADFARSLRAEFPEMSAARARSIAVTEYANIASNATRESYAEAGIPKKKWNTVGDGFVCEICAGNEDQGAIAIDQEFKSGHQNPAAHPNCRCNISGSK